MIHYSWLCNGLFSSSPCPPPPPPNNNGYSKNAQLTQALSTCTLFKCACFQDSVHTKCTHTYLYLRAMPQDPHSSRVFSCFLSGQFSCLQINASNITLLSLPWHFRMMHLVKTLTLLSANTFIFCQPYECVYREIILLCWLQTERHFIMQVVCEATQSADTRVSTSRYTFYFEPPYFHVPTACVVLGDLYKK